MSAGLNRNFLCHSHVNLFQDCCKVLMYLLPIGSEERGVSGFGSIPVTILPSCQDMETIAL